MGNKMFCPPEQGSGRSKRQKTEAVVTSFAQDDVVTTEAAYHHHDESKPSSSPTKKSPLQAIPPNIPVDYPLQVFERRARQGQLPVFDNSNQSVEFQTKDYRAFALLIHQQHGAILLYCTRKAHKGPHYQLPGGHVDLEEFQAVMGSGTAAQRCTPQQLYLSARMGCAREIYEETSIDLRNDIDRLLPMILHENGSGDSSTKDMCNFYKDRLFFCAQVVDQDFSSSHPEGSVRYQSLPQGGSGAGYSCNLMLQLSVEHSGFKFAKSPSAVVESLQLHSGGKVSKAVAMAYNVDSGDNNENESASKL